MREWVIKCGTSLCFLLKEKKNEYTSISRGRQDSSYSRESYREREREAYTEADYSDTDIQSGLTEARPGDQRVLG